MLFNSISTQLSKKRFQNACKPKGVGGGYTTAMTVNQKQPQPQTHLYSPTTITTHLNSNMQQRYYPQPSKLATINERLTNNIDYIKDRKQYQIKSSHRARSFDGRSSRASITSADKRKGNHYEIQNRHRGKQSIYSRGFDIYSQKSAYDAYRPRPTTESFSSVEEIYRKPILKSDVKSMLKSETKSVESFQDKFGLGFDRLQTDKFRYQQDKYRSQADKDRSQIPQRDTFLSMEQGGDIPMRDSHHRANITFKEDIFKQEKDREREREKVRGVPNREPVYHIPPTSNPLPTSTQAKSPLPQPQPQSIVKEILSPLQLHNEKVGFLGILKQKIGRIDKSGSIVAFSLIALVLVILIVQSLK